ncbi:MAG: sugar phosphorylase [Syntrophales bacterium]|nr:sugar phosphorylase [Syntrophales bacterium]
MHQQIHSFWEAADRPVDMKSYHKYPRERTFHTADPDFKRPLYKVPREMKLRLTERLLFLYGHSAALAFMPELERMLQVHFAHKPAEMIEKEAQYDPLERFSEKDLILISYGDMVADNGKSTLATLNKFLDLINEGSINTLHILPFFPYSSDRGFAVVDFKRVDPKLGDWSDIKGQKLRYDLMFDAVLNHVSSRSELFREFLKGNKRYLDFFTSYDSPEELTADQRRKIFRPRTTDILTPFHTIHGPKWLWSTFSKDQIDLNFRNPDVLMHIVDALLFYIRRGADILRLDAVTYLWDEPGTECIHLPQTHMIIKLLRDIINAVASGVAILTETNVPHDFNISYFGNGYDEAHMVYNFALPPLVLSAFYRGDARKLSEWAAGLEPPSPLSTFFNVLDTHDGIGLIGAKGILPDEEINYLIAQVKQRGGYVSYSTNCEKTLEPYELNTTWWSAVNGDSACEDEFLQIRRYCATRSIALAMKGVPGIYMHGALGTANDHVRVEETAVIREVNRGIIKSEKIEEELKNPSSRMCCITAHMNRLYNARTTHRAFHPRGGQKILRLSPALFAVLRTSPEKDKTVLALTNVTFSICTVEIPALMLQSPSARWHDILSCRTFTTGSTGTMRITLEPYEILWLEPA